VVGANLHRGVPDLGHEIEMKVPHVPASTVERCAGMAQVREGIFTTETQRHREKLKRSLGKIAIAALSWWF
jgi:hypothetical protein